MLLGLPILCLTSSIPQMSCRIPLFSRVIYSVGNELLILLLAAFVIYAWWDSEVWLFCLLVSRYYAHTILTCVKQNNILICLCDLMLHTLINKILNVNIME